jgi:hypothetical protein
VRHDGVSLDFLFSLDLSLCRPTGFHSGLSNTIENVLSLAKETVSCSSELNRAFGADEQLYFQFFLERFDLAIAG